jgi:hypothetical protein
MPAGFIFKQCACPDPEPGRPLYGRCPQILLAKGQWNPDHGAWAYRIPLPPATPGKARPLIRYGLASQDDAQGDLDHVRYLLSLAGRDRETRIEVADIIKAFTGRGRKLPDAAEVRRRMVRNTLPGCPYTLAEYLTEWFTEKAKLGTIRESTAASYETTIRVHLIPHLGHLHLADLQPRHVKAMFIAIVAAGHVRGADRWFDQAVCALQPAAGGDVDVDRDRVGRSGRCPDGADAGDGRGP